MGKLRPYFTESARGAAEGRAERLCREECCKGGCRVEMQRCATERRFRGVLENAMQRINGEDNCREVLQRDRMGVAAGSAEMGFYRRALQRSAERDKAEEF
jgi:hypothetical protein